MSGTSGDGVDIAITRVRGDGLETEIELIDFSSRPFPEDLRSQIFSQFRSATLQLRELCQLNFRLGEFFASVILSAIGEANLTSNEIELIGSHGQTIYHLPPRQNSDHTPSTLQIGEAATIAHRTNIPVVSDFRVADIAVGGQGAPLVPYADFLTHREKDRTVALQNIGGISNFTLIPARSTPAQIIASDTGPGNMVIDAVVEFISGGTRNYDAEGKIAAQGKPIDRLVDDYLANHPFFKLEPPKTTGREEFGEKFTKDFIDRAKLFSRSENDLVATATELTARTIFEHYKKFLPLEKYKIDEILLSGGGAKNLTLHRRLSELFDPIPVKLMKFAEAREAISFAILANEFIHGNCGNLPQVTKADFPVILGKFTPAHGQ